VSEGGEKMDEQRLNRMEEMLSNLIQMVGHTNEQLQEVKVEQQEMNRDLSGIRGEITEMKKDISIINGEITEMKKDITVINAEITQMKNKLNDMHADQDHIWEKAARNERELAKLKSHLQF
jgi:chromosome segregation ATPase